MPERDIEGSVEHGLRSESRPDHLDSYQRKSTIQLIETLQLHLDRLRMIENPRAREIAILCQAELDHIRGQIRALSEEESPANTGSARHGDFEAF